MTAERDLPYGIPPAGFRLPSDARVGRVTLQVADVARSLDYYEQTIGLTVVSRSAETAALAPAGGAPVLVELHGRRGARAAHRRGTFGLFHFAVLLPDRPSLGRFLRHTLDRRAVSGLSDHAVSEAIYLYDPDGLGIEVYADRPRESWRVGAGRELYMTTEPLDVGSVIAAGSDRPWDGAPSGTTMGHVHLHVGNLDGAEAFYHRALGLDKTVWTYPGALFLSAGGYHHHLGANTWASGGAPADDQARLVSWDLEVSDPDAVTRSLASAGYRIETADGVPRAADPWGTVVRIRGQQRT
jgi:catechol 2,3-dioxygenase